MIHEAMTKYDAEIAKCTDYYSKQCALMEVAHEQISAANIAAAVLNESKKHYGASVHTCFCATLV